MYTHTLNLSLFEFDIHPYNVHMRTYMRNCQYLGGLICVPIHVCIYIYIYVNTEEHHL